MYQFANIPFGRPIRVKTILYFLFFSALLVALYFLPFTGDLIAKIPFGVLVMIPVGFAWLLSDIGTEDRSPLKFFISFFKYQFKKISRNTYYRGRKIARIQPYTFHNYLSFSSSNHLVKDIKNTTNVTSKNYKCENDGIVDFNKDRNEKKVENDYKDDLLKHLFD